MYACQFGDDLESCGLNDFEFAIFRYAVRRKYMFILHDVPRGKPSYGRQFGYIQMPPDATLSAMKLPQSELPRKEDELLPMVDELSSKGV